jgi:hypothetical protein
MAAKQSADTPWPDVQAGWTEADSKRYQDLAAVPSREQQMAAIKRRLGPTHLESPLQRRCALSR